MAAVNNPRFPHTCRITRTVNAGPMTDEDTAIVVYEGVCRGFNRDTQSGNGDVSTSYRMLALPQKQDEWTEETIPQEGDKVELYRFGYTEYGLVVDRRPSNLGTHIMWKYVRN